jgi:hypothetical protein
MTETPEPNPEAERQYRCSIAAVWLPRILAASLLVSGLFAAREIDPAGVVPFSGPVRTVIVIAAAAGALWLVRGGSEVRLRVAVDSTHLTFSAGRHSRKLPIADVRALDFVSAFGTRTRWMPAVVIADRHGGRWRVPAVLREGSQLVETIVERSEREELRAWAEARRLHRRIARAAYLVPVGYVVALALPLLALWLLMG